MPKGQRATLDDKLRAAHFIVEGLKISEVAEKIGMSRSAVSNWLNNDAEFHAILSDMHSAISRSTHQRMIGLADTAVSTLADVCENGNTDSARVAAAKEILSRLAPVDNTDLVPDSPAELGEEYDDIRDRIREQMNEQTRA